MLRANLRGNMTEEWGWFCWTATCSPARYTRAARASAGPRARAAPRTPGPDRATHLPDASRPRMEHGSEREGDAVFTLWFPEMGMILGKSNRNLSDVLWQVKWIWNCSNILFVMLFISQWPVLEMATMAELQRSTGSDMKIQVFKYSSVGPLGWQFNNQPTCQPM